jgi:membrane-associated phospholipid phosphatase
MSEFLFGLTVALAVGGILLYFPTNRIHAPGRWFFHDTWLDKYIPLVPYFIIPYVALFPYMVATAIAMLYTTHLTTFITAIAIVSWTAAIVWYFFPSGILRKRDIGPDFFSRMIVWIYEHDHENNTFPSSHVYYAIICSYFLTLSFPQFALLFAVVGGLITISTVLVKQHHAADILGGIVWAAGAISIAHYLVG